MRISTVKYPYSVKRHLSSINPPIDMKFEFLPLSAKIIIVEQFGELVSRLEEGGRHYALYLINDFYAEVRYKGNTKIIESIEKLHEGTRLHLYCPDLDL